MLYLTTSVGLGYGRRRTSRRSFSRRMAQPEDTRKTYPRHTSGHDSPGFAWGRPRMLGPGKPPPDPACHPRHSTRYPTGNRFPTRIPPDPPKGEGRNTRRLASSFRVLSVRGRYGNINPFIHSTTPVGLALGPDSPRDDERGPGTLGHPAAGILAPLSLLMSAFSLPHRPPRLTPRLRPAQDALLPNSTYYHCRVFGGVLEPRYIVGAEPLDQ